MMKKSDLVARYQRMMRERGLISILGGPVTADDYRSAIWCMERSDEFSATHLAEFGPGHETCGHMNWQPLCKPCGATNGADGTCTKPADHRIGSPDPARTKSPVHIEWRDGALRAEWQDPPNDEDHPGDCGCPECTEDEVRDTADEHDYDDEMYHGTGREPAGWEEW